MAIIQPTEPLTQRMTETQPHNPYLQHIHAVLPRVLALFDRDPTSRLYGYGDRLFWGWKLIDFANGTMQGLAHGLAQLLTANLLPQGMNAESILDRIDSMIRAAGSMRRRDGSMEEAFPYEGSYCVTALVAYDILRALDLLDGRIDSADREAYLDVVEPMIRFVKTHDEQHAFISNHLATAVAALYRWAALTGDNQAAQIGETTLSRILQQQHEEGWYREYQGADPGYQSLCTIYLADAQSVRPNDVLLESLRQSLQFLWYFAHPDGSFGGVYGSRGTRFYFPSGVASLAEALPEAAALTAHMQTSIAENRCVTLAAIDTPGLPPLFNSYCHAAALFEQPQSTEMPPTLPCAETTDFRQHFTEAGLLIDRSPEHYTIVSLHKGGVVYHFRQDQAARIDAGVAARGPHGKCFSSQSFCPKNAVEISEDAITITASLTQMHRMTPSPAKFAILRLMCLSVMRSTRLREWIKRILVKLMITDARELPIQNVRTIRLGPDLDIGDEFRGQSDRFTRLSVQQPFSSIHMASQGYWQRQDDQS